MEHQFYAEDTCVLIGDPNKQGHVDRTHSDVSTHHPIPPSAYPQGVQNLAGVSNAEYNEFLLSGVPPRGHVVVTFMPLRPNVPDGTVLVAESALKLLDRSLMTGDVVKRQARDASSGTVIDVKMTTSLIPPTAWKKPGFSTSEVASMKFGNYDSNPAHQLHSIPAHELKDPIEWEDVTSFLIYHDWVGRVSEPIITISVRLADGSIVEVEDSHELQPNDALNVGDYVMTKKGNLRRGEWIYGAYNASISPAGFVADVRVNAVEVQWLCRRYNPNKEAAELWPEPPWRLEREILESGEVHVYDGTDLLNSHDANGDTRLANCLARRFGEGLTIGDRVRFRNLDQATQKYPGLNRIPKTAALGYDINVFMISSTQTTVTVLWQDLTTSQHASVDLVPNIDLDDEDEVWPGEIITTRTAKQIEALRGADPLVFQPSKVGVVQSVHAKNRIAQVRWFEQAEVYLSGEDKSTLLPGSFTGPSSENIEEVSLYEIWTVPGLNRRIGDYVMILPSDEDSAPNNGHSQQQVSQDVTEKSIEWFGQVVELGLDGKCTVCLAASIPPRITRVPIERTLMVYSTDFDKDIDMEDTDSEYERSLSDEYYDMDSNDGAIDVSIEYEGGMPLDENAAEDSWSTESEDGDVPMQDTDLSEAYGTDVDDILTDEAPKEVSSISKDTQETKHFVHTTSDNHILERTPVGNFEILDTPVPTDHHFCQSGSPGNLSGQRLRRIHKEYKVLRSSLPDGVFCRTWESRLDLLRVLIIGPVGTPYEFAPFLIDFYLDHNFPLEPPQTFFHSWTNRGGPINPNLYEDGKICLSLLGTWAGREQHENWSPSTSTILQVLVSILGLVLVEEPYFNEAGYEARAGTAESQLPSELYTERTYFRSRAFIAHAITHPIAGFEDVVTKLYTSQKEDEGQLLALAIVTAIRVVQRSGREAPVGNNEGTAADKGRRVSAGALVPLRRSVAGLIELLRGYNAKQAQDYAEMLGSG